MVDLARNGPAVSIDQRNTCGLEAVVLVAVGLRREALMLVAGGLAASEAARVLGVGRVSVCRWAKLAGMRLQPGRRGGLAELRPARRPTHRRAPEGPYVDDNGRLDLAGRVVIQLRLAEKHSYRRIAAELGVAPSTVSREVTAHRVEGVYRAKSAHRAAVLARARPKPGKLAVGSPLRAEVVAGLDNKLSPEQIAGRLRRDHPGEHDRQVSHETIYQALYVQGAGGLRHELTVEKALRQGRTSRRPRSKLPARTNRSWIGEATISNRPAEAADRAVPGHWEGDLIIGTEGRSALITLNERRSRFTLISRVCTHDTDTVTSRLIETISGLPAELFTTLTWDQGVEMAGHARFGVATGTKVYFADPHSPWQRPTNENSNGLIRDFFPKGTDFTQISDHQVADAQRLLNTRPRKVLAYATPAETLNELLTVALTP